jgi:5'-nucleotidase
MTLRPLASRIAAAVLGFAAVACASAPAEQPGPVTVHLVGINDFHGNLETPTGTVFPDPENPGATTPPDSGGVSRLATLAGELLARPNSIMVGAGDLIGATPLLSGLFHDEPSIEALSQMGLALSAVGNHEFDEGLAEIRRIQTGGCHPVDGCRGPSEYKGAGFQYLAAGTIDTASGETVFPASVVREFDGVRVGFIGLSLQGVHALISPSARVGIDFLDEAETINRETAKLKANGVQTIVVLIHEGGYPGPEQPGCEGMTGPIVSIVPKLDRAVDVIVSGHTHMAYVCEVDGRLLTSAGKYGVMLTDIELTIDRTTGDVTAAEGRNVVVRKDRHAENPAQVALLTAYKRIAAALIERVAGATAEALQGDTEDANGENAMGAVIADSMRAAAETATGDPADVAFMNPGGIRAGLGKDDSVTFAELYTVQPFGNALYLFTLTGAQIETVLAQQFSASGSGDNILHVSAGSGFHWRRNAAGVGEIIPGSVRIDGKPLDRAATYRLVTNDFMFSGGDGFTALGVGQNVQDLGSDVAALEAWFRAHSPVKAPAKGRVVKE